MGGWIANAGSCKIGFKPSPSSTNTEFTRKGFEVKITNSEKIKNRPLCILRTAILKLFIDLVIKEYKNPYIEIIQIHRRIEPSWFPQAPVIL